MAYWLHYPRKIARWNSLIHNSSIHNMEQFHSQQKKQSHQRVAQVTFIMTLSKMCTKKNVLHDIRFQPFYFPKNVTIYANGFLIKWKCFSLPFKLCSEQHWKQLPLSLLLFVNVKQQPILILIHAQQDFLFRNHTTNKVGGGGTQVEFNYSFQVIHTAEKLKSILFDNNHHDLHIQQSHPRHTSKPTMQSHHHCQNLLHINNLKPFDYFLALILLGTKHLNLHVFFLALLINVLHQKCESSCTKNVNHHAPKM